jgi:hypoxanthine phosphoribosyltransferase
VTDAGRRLATRRLLFPRDRIAARVAELGAAISRDHAGGDLVLVGVLTGSFVFLADLARALTVPARIDFVGVSSYGAGAAPGPLRVTKEPSLDLAGSDTVLVDDLADTGGSLAALRELVARAEPRTLAICVLLDKTWRRAREVRLDYVGFTIERGFVVGYGIDYAGEGRCLPDLWTLPE